MNLRQLWVLAMAAGINTRRRPRIARLRIARTYKLEWALRQMDPHAW